MDKGLAVLLQMRIEEFDELWEEFNSAHLLEDSVEFKQVIFGLPIESLKDWKRAKDEKRIKK